MAPKLVEDDILSDILGEIDTNNVVIRPGPITAIRRSSNERNEKKLVHQFMQEFTKPTTVVNDTKADDVIYFIETFYRNFNVKLLSAIQDLIEEMFKKNKSKPKLPAPSARSSVASVAPRKDESAKTSLETLSIETPTTPEPSHDEDLANMDYSILEDNENQFETNPQPADAVDPTISEAESYATLFQNWENTCNMMTDPEETTTSSNADQGSAITDEVCFVFGANKC